MLPCDKRINKYQLKKKYHQRFLLVATNGSWSLAWALVSTSSATPHLDPLWAQLYSQPIMTLLLLCWSGLRAGEGMKKGGDWVCVYHPPTTTSRAPYPAADSPLTPGWLQHPPLLLLFSSPLLSAWCLAVKREGWGRGEKETEWDESTIERRWKKERGTERERERKQRLGRAVERQKKQKKERVARFGPVLERFESQLAQTTALSNQDKSRAAVNNCSINFQAGFHLLLSLSLSFCLSSSFASWYLLFVSSLPFSHRCCAPCVFV